MSERPDTQFSTLEVDQSVNLPQHRPGENDMPEPIPQSPEKADAFAKVPPTTICGLHKRTFWMTVGAVAACIIIGIAVGVGVGVGKKDKESTAPVDNAVVNTTDSTPRGVLRETKLAAANYTDADGAEHSQIYYQNATTWDIWMGDFNSATNNWTFSTIRAQNNDTPIEPRNGLQYPDFHIRFVDKNNTMRALWASNMSNDWSMEQKLDDQDLPVGTDSGLATYGPECPSENACDENNFVIYGITGGKQYICYPFVYDGKPYQLSGYDYNGADSGSALAVAPVPIVKSRNDTGTRVALYMRSAGKLVEMYGYLGHWGMSTFDLPTSIDDGGQLAAMNLHTTAQGSNTTDVLNSWVFITQSTGGVKLVYGGGFVPGDAWNSINSIKNMEDVVPLSPVAATQAGKVYALEDKDDGTRRIVEWRRESGDDITFERSQEVETPE
ncbi:hypothetical protein SLS55_010243 [Diplodia seriata]|uniref:Uncharacterized protein n=1 Tax=Diplodia seriata TaxID=420778 RepID=A0ABR3BY02_9PEZI